MTGRGVDFYAPMKSPDDPRPSGDRTMARALMAALDAPDFESAYGPLALASTVTSRDGEGSDPRQDALFAAAAAERLRLAKTPPPAVWLTYHCYYKAPDLLGPAVAERGALYAIVEPSRSAKRLNGPWARFAAAAEAAIGRADVLFYLTERDRPALDAELKPHQVLRRLPPFLADIGRPPTPRRAPSEGPLRLLTVAMMRPGDKMESFKALARAMALLQSDWRLDIVGDGSERRAVEALFAPFASRVRVQGRLEGAALVAAYDRADLFVWPGVNEAYGLVYLEAQARGLPVVCEDRPGVRDVARNGALRTRENDPAALAEAIDALALASARRQALGAAARAQIEAEHSLAAARRALAEGLADAWDKRRSARR